MSNPELKYRGKVALVTGASSGIGQATALAFAKQGAAVILTDVSVEGGNRTTEMIEKLGSRALFIRCDVSKADEVRSMMGKSMEAFGRVDFAFNNAGIEGAQAMTQDCTEQNWDQVMNINLKGIWLCMKYQIPQMLKQGGGAIVNCSSIAGLVGFPGIPAYCASKHAVIGLTKTTALECARSNIRINAVCPGVIQTPMVDRLVHGNAQEREALLENEPIGRVGKPEEIADAVLWLCSEGASFVTGHSLAVDGGWLAR